MDKTRILIFYWITIILDNFSQGCVFYTRNGYDSEADGVRFIRVRENLPIGGEVLNLKAFPRNSIALKGLERSTDYTYFRLNEINSTSVQIVLDKSLEDLVDRDIPQNLLKFKIQCLNYVGRVEEASYLTVTVYVEDINDHFPKFIGAPYHVNVEESTPVGTTIFTGIAAFDRDKPNTPNSDIQFSIGSQEWPGSPYFGLENPHRPLVILKKALDYDEGIRQFDITIIASDRGTPQKSSNTTLRVYVGDSDDLPPKFTEGVYRTKIKEFPRLTGQAVRVPLHFDPQILAMDQDSLNTSLYYEIISGNERELFSVNPFSGVIFLEKEIDLEEESLPGNTFVLQMEAKQLDNPLKRALARIEIEILDLNDNAPEFEVDLYNISIVENLPSGFSVLQVNAVDRDQGENSEFIYQMFHEKPPGAFSVDPRTGWLTVRDQNLLDREARQTISMIIQAVEKTPPYEPRHPSAGKVTVEIALLDANDNTPEFEMGNLYEFKVNVNAELGHIVGHVKANDPDEGRNGKILYELQKPRQTGVIPFKLDSTTGALSVSGPLNIGRMALFVEATDQPANPSERRFSLAVVTIEIVRHKSDEKIGFIGAPYEFWVGSDVGIGTSVGQIRTTIDWDMEGDVVYDLLHSYSEGVPFAVEERSGTVTVIKKLEEFNRTVYEFEAVAAQETYINRQRSNKDPKTKLVRGIRSPSEIESDELSEDNNKNILTTNVTIHVVDRDENNGILMRGTVGDPIEFHVKENVAGAMIGQLLYINKPNETKKEPHKDSFGTSTVSLSQIKRNSRQMNSTKFNRNVIKFNEIPNSNTKRRYRQTDSETSFFVSVTPSVIFDDLLMSESTVSPQSPFLLDIDEERKKLEINDDRKRVPRSRLYHTRRYESGRTGRQAVLPPSDTTGNRSTIIFERNRFSTTTTTTETSVTNLPLQPEALRRSPNRNDSMKKTFPNVVIRKKLDFEPNRGLRYLIANQQDVTDMITITNDGILMTTTGLDREVRDVYRLTVIAEYSKQFASGAGIYQVTVFVDDENDNAPTFNHNSYTGMISENCKIGSNVMLNQPIIVKDADIGENAEFSLALFGDGSQLFGLELVNGTDQLNFSDSLNTSNSVEKNFASLQIMFLESLNALGRIPHYIVRYIGPINLDRERESVYNLKLVARDKGGLKSEVKLGIMIADVNDNPPIFDKIAVFKNTGIEVLEHAHDIEIYFLDHMTNENMKSSPKTSDMKNSKLRYETSSPSGFAPQKDRFKEIVERVPVGAPRGLITSSSRRRNLRHSRNTKSSKRIIPTFSILENTVVGNSLLKMSATDDDLEANSQIFYEIVHEEYIPNPQSPRPFHTMKYFNIDRISGEIKLNRQLPAESEIKLNISAKDIGGLVDFAMIRFKVLDVNDHQPVFEKSWYTFDIDEGEYFDHALGKIEAYDEDFGQNAVITYSIESLEELPFTISPKTGQLSVDGELDREERSIYEFKVMAADNATESERLFSLVEVEVNVLDLNDNAPEFTGYDEIYEGEHLAEQPTKKLNSYNYFADIEEDESNGSGKIPVYKAYLNRDTEPGSLVKQVTAIDKDFTGNGNGLVMYSLVQNTLPYTFDIDTREGIIHTVSKLSTKYHGYEHVNLTVIATDLGSPSRSSSALVIINLQGDEYVSDEIDGDSIFNHKYFEIEVAENNPVPMIVLKINTTDDDEKYRWDIIKEHNEINYNEIFRIDPNNGTLWLVKSLDREQQDLYKLKIRAERLANRGSRNAPANLMYPVSGDRIEGLSKNEVRIIIRVLDENDNEPQFAITGRPIVAVIPHTASFGYHVTTVHAFDHDIGLNAEIRFSLLNEPSNIFGIDPVTGIIRILGTILKDSSHVYGFDVKATDREGADDGKSSITNVVVYVLDEGRQVRLVLSGQPIQVEKEIDNLTRVLSDATDLDVRVRILEPHSSEKADPATNVYVYAVDPKTNTIVDMEELQTMMSSVNMQTIYPPLPVVEEPQLGGPKTFNPKSTVFSSNYAAFNGSELASIILAITVFAGGLATTVCIVCVRYKRRHGHASSTGLAYAIARTKVRSSIRTDRSKTSNESRMSGGESRPRLYSDNYSRTSYTRDREREYIDVPLPQSVLSANYTSQDHDKNCIKFNQIRNNPTPQTPGDTSAPSLHSSGRDSGLDLAQLSDTPSRNHNLNDKINIDSWNRITSCICHDRNDNLHKKYQSTKPISNDESDSYDDSLKDHPLHENALPQKPLQNMVSQLRRNMRSSSICGPSGSVGLARQAVRHSFSGVHDLVQTTPAAIINRTRFVGSRNSVADLEERLRNIGITFHEPFILNNSRC